ncbi:type II toxin-antitoxin system HicB family antitoxin [bacterium]|nr:type II toxin-antitoxin system HicB family antitoxin [Verrucomicrobiota bacterium]MDA7510659.1 type II toxin-antitoxin system HicB family antitoxin [Verrucomicrobiota bacterium]MDA7633451.1 type II toxin-antitoxin system HicB family antitoxin [bacterium]MDB4796861.1 type II toxin-antitoxin system HicB family antitoxin [bacterium]
MIVYWSDKDEAYVAEVPELPGCIADGQRAVEAVENAEEVICQWIEIAKSFGRDIPNPKGRLAFA